MKTVDCTLVLAVQERAEIYARENRAKNYSAATRKKKENINELTSGFIWATFIVGMLFIGFII